MHCMNIHPASKFNSFNFATLYTKKAHGTNIFLETGRHRFHYFKCVLCKYEFWPLQPLWDPVLPRAMMAPNLPSTISQTSTSYPNTGELLGTLETLLDWKMQFWQFWMWRRLWWFSDFLEDFLVWWRETICQHSFPLHGLDGNSMILSSDRSLISFFFLKLGISTPNRWFP